MDLGLFGGEAAGKDKVMKTGKGQIRQGDVLLDPVEELPVGATLTDDVGVKIAGERTGHSHQLVGRVATLGSRRFVKGGNVLQHEEHEHVATEPTWYEVVVQREHIPQQAPSFRWD